MFGIGIFELLIIGILVLLFVKPKDLPRFFFKVGKFYSKVMSSYQTILREMNTFRTKVGDWRRDLNEMIDMEKIVAAKPETLKNVFDKKKSPKRKTQAKRKPSSTQEKVKKRKTAKSTSKKKETASLSKATAAGKRKKTGERR